MCFNQRGYILTLNGGSLKPVEKFIYLRSSISSPENDMKVRLAKAWTAIDRLSAIWKSNLSYKKKSNFFKAAVVSILLYRCTTRMLTKRIQKTLDCKCTRMLRTILKKSWFEHPTKQLLCGHLFPVSRTIYIRQQDMWDTTGEETNSLPTFSHRPYYVDVQMLDE